MKSNTVIFNPDEKDVLLHSLFEKELELQGVMKDIIADFDKVDLEKPVKTKKERISTLTILLEDNEKSLPLLTDFYENYYGYEKNSLEARKLEAGIYYMICKILLVRCKYREGLNKLLYAASFQDMPSKFIYLCMFRTGSIYIEQGKIQEAGDVFKVAAKRCRLYADDPLMLKLELLILYQSLRVDIIRGNLIGARWFIDDITRKLAGGENIIFSSLCGYYYRWSGDLKEAHRILNKAYRKYAEKEDIQKTYARSWFNVKYQLACCLLDMKRKDSIEKARDLIMEAYSHINDYNYRNRGYSENTLGLISMGEGDFEKALEHFEKAWELFEKYTDYRNMARSKRNMGAVLKKMKRYPEAIKRFNQSLDYDNHTQLEIGVVLTLLHKIDIQTELIQYYKARESLTKIEMIKLPLNHFLLDEIDKRKQKLDNIVLCEGIIGESKPVSEIRNAIKLYAQRIEPLFITGESGSGRSFIAQEIHKQSRRKGKLIIVNPQQIPLQRLESEIFGRQSKGEETIGLLEQAHKGTILIKEVCDLPVLLQTKLSRFIDEKKIRPVSGHEEKSLDVKIIFVTKHNNIHQKIAEGDFNKDFYNNISDFPIMVPPLRERRDDIRKLAEYFYVTECKNLKKKICGIQTCAMNLLEDYPWPDNIRELQKTIKRCMVKIENGQPLDRENVLSALDRNFIKPIVIEKKKEEPEENIEDRLQELEEKIQQQQEEPPRTRATDSYRIINEVFKIIQEKGPVRKLEVASLCPDAGKSFHHWVNILKDKHKVITVEDTANYKVYSPVPLKILNKMLETGELLKKDKLFTVVEF